MTLTEKHIEYENDCRKMFVGQIIRGVIYGEIKHDIDDNGNNIDPKPYYNTKYQEIDTLDYSIYFKTDEKTIYLFWDNTFICYGIKSKQIVLTDNTNDYEQKWDVSFDKKWIDFIGQKITNFKIDWLETCASNLDGTNKVYTTYPQTFTIMIDNQKTIIVTASELIRPDEKEVFHLMDNLLITTNMNLARQLKMIS